MLRITMVPLAPLPQLACQGNQKRFETRNQQRKYHQNMLKLTTISVQWHRSHQENQCLAAMPWHGFAALAGAGSRSLGISWHQHLTSSCHLVLSHWRVWEDDLAISESVLSPGAQVPLKSSNVRLLSTSCFPWTLKIPNSDLTCRYHQAPQLFLIAIYI